MDSMEEAPVDLQEQNPDDTSAPQCCDDQSSQYDNTDPLENSMDADHSAPKESMMRPTENDDTAPENEMDVGSCASQGPTMQPAENDDSPLENSMDVDSSAHAVLTIFTDLPVSPFQLNEKDISNTAPENEMDVGSCASQGPTMQPAEKDDTLQKKFFVHLEGKTNGAHQDFVTKLQRAGCIEVESVEESEIRLVFCPIVSRVGTDISNALENIPDDDKSTILVVMHPTFNPDKVLTDSRKLVERKNIKLTVDCLFHDGKFLMCKRNHTAWTEIKRFLKLSSPQGSTISISLLENKMDADPSAHEVSTLQSNSNSSKKKFFVKLEGKTNGAHQDVVTKLQRAGCIEVESEEESEIRLVFCPIVSRAEMDISYALENIPDDDKPTILVVMHHTFKPDKVLTDSRKQVERKNIKLTVDCLFHDGKLLKCNRNETAWTEIKRFLKLSSPQGSTISISPLENKMDADPSAHEVSTMQSNSNSSKKKFFVKLEGKTNGAHQDFVTKLKDIGHIEVDSEEESEIRLVFCPIVSRAEMDISYALENIPDDDKSTILVVMHPTFKPDKVLTDSRKLVKKQNVKLTVDCLFHDGKLLKCKRNDTAWVSIQDLVGVPPPEKTTYSGVMNAIQRRFQSLPTWSFYKT